MTQSYPMDTTFAQAVTAIASLPPETQREIGAALLRTADPLPIIE